MAVAVAAGAGAVAVAAAAVAAGSVVAVVAAAVHDHRLATLEAAVPDRWAAVGQVLETSGSPVVLVRPWALCLVQIQTLQADSVAGRSIVQAVPQVWPSRPLEQRARPAEAEIWEAIALRSVVSGNRRINCLTQEIRDPPLADSRTLECQLVLHFLTQRNRS